MKLKRLDRINQIIIAILLAMVSFVQAAEEKPLALVPYPRSVVRLSDGAYELNSKTAIVYANKAAKQPAEMLAKALRTATGYDLPVKLDDYEAGSRYTVRMENCKSKGWKTLGDVLMHKDN